MRTEPVITLCNGLQAVRTCIDEAKELRPDSVIVLIMLRREVGEDSNCVLVHSDIVMDPGPVELYDLVGDDGNYLARDAQGNDLFVPKDQIVYATMEVHTETSIDQPQDD